VCQKLNSSIVRITRKIERAKQENVPADKLTKHNRKIKKDEEDLQSAQQSMTWVKMKSNVFILMGFSIVIISALSTSYDGTVICKLPFEPIPLFRFMTHRGLSGSDFQDCSYIFIYVLCMMNMRGNIQKWFGTAPPKNSSPFFK